MTSEGYDASDEERWALEPPKSSSRTAFQRDRARLIHSSALRRLGAKTQILVAGTDDFARTRLTHTLEVAQIGRQIGSSLGCDPDVVDCACLAHDLGHPPFGHNGERALAEIARDIGGFEGNAQTLRLLTRLEPKVMFPDGRSAGVNLTRAALDAAVKYPWTLDEAAAHPKGERSAKFCVYPDDTDVFDWLKRGAPDSTRRPIECQVMDLADDIAYSVHDVEDAIATGAFDPGVLRDGAVIDAIAEDARAWYGPQWDGGKLVDAFARMRARGTFPDGFDGSRRALARLKNMTSDLIGRFAGSVEHATKDTYGADPLTVTTAIWWFPRRRAMRSWRSKALPCISSWRPENAIRCTSRNVGSSRIWSTCSWRTIPDRPPCWRTCSSTIGVGPRTMAPGFAWPSTRWPASPTPPR